MPNAIDRSVVSHLRRNVAIERTLVGFGLGRLDSIPRFRRSAGLLRLAGLAGRCRAIRVLRLVFVPGRARAQGWRGYSFPWPGWQWVQLQLVPWIVQRHQKT